MYEKNNLRDLHDWSLNGHSCWEDFVKVAHNDFYSDPIDFKTYGYIELELIGKCLSIFSNNGYDEVTRLIDEVLEEIKEEETETV